MLFFCRLQWPCFPLVHSYFILANGISSSSSGMPSATTSALEPARDPEPLHSSITGNPGLLALNYVQAFVGQRELLLGGALPQVAVLPSQCCLPSLAFILELSVATASPIHPSSEKSLPLVFLKQQPCVQRCYTGKEDWSVNT